MVSSMTSRTTKTSKKKGFDLETCVCPKDEVRCPFPCPLLRAAAGLFEAIAARLHLGFGAGRSRAL